jgi:hypothetical protein
MQTQLSQIEGLSKVSSTITDIQAHLEHVTIKLASKIYNCFDMRYLNSVHERLLDATSL